MGEATMCNALYLYRTGKYMDAIRKFESAAVTASEYKEIDIELDCFLYIQRIFGEIGKRQMAETWLKKIDKLKKESTDSSIKHDEYSELVSANYLLSSGRNHRHHQTHYKRIHDALRKFQQILVTNPNNIYAVHGMGVAAAESQELGLAKSILSKLRDCGSSEATADMLVNLGHIFSAYQQWDNALKCYEKSLRRLSDPNKFGDIPLYIVRTLFAKKDFISAKNKLHQILRYNPTQELYLYNLALIEEEYSCHILRKSPQLRTLKEIENVMKMLENAKRIYQRLNYNKKTAATIPHDKLKQHLDHIKNELLENAKKHLEFQKSEELRKRKKRESEKRKYLKTLEKERREIEKQKELERLKREKSKKREEKKLCFKSQRVEELDQSVVKNESRSQWMMNSKEWNVRRSGVSLIIWISLMMIVRMMMILIKIIIDLQMMRRMIF